MRPRGKVTINLETGSRGVSIVGLVTPTLLIVDDEKSTRDGLRTALEDKFDVYAAPDAAGAWQLLEKEPVDVLLTDLRMAGDDGLALIRKAKALPKPPVCILMTAYGSEDLAVEAMKQGADDYISKGRLQIDELELRIQRALRRHRLETENEQLHQRLDQRFGMENFIGETPSIREVFEQIQQIGPSTATVLITGESGTGKELAARLIHAQGPRAEGPFVAVNCGAIPQDLVESELFGHKKGSFTGAVADKEGLFQAAEGGTLFLDEVADLPLPAQVKILRAIQEKGVRPVGAQREVAVDVRIISASHRDLGAEVELGRFRQDLFYRINVIELRMPALREHPQDIPALTGRIMARIAQQHGERPPLTVTAEALAALGRHAFPGNVRELENILERAAALGDGPVIGAHDLYLPQTETTDLVAQPTDSAVPLEDYLGKIERAAIVKALDETRWNRTAAARKLGMTLRALRYRLAKLGIE